MDKNTIKAIASQFVAAIEAEGYAIDFAGIPPVLPEYERPYSLQLYAPIFLEMGISKAVRMLVYKKHELLSVEIRKVLTDIQVCRNIEDIACRQEDIIVNKIQYQPLTIPYRFLEMV
jgi:hypothetical protein